MVKMDLLGKVAIVTASTSGIGLEIALTLAKNHAIVYLAARNEEKAKFLINQHPDLNLHYVHFDVTEIESCTQSIEEVYHKEGRIDILVNNYGGTKYESDKTIYDTDYENYQEIVELNTRSVFLPTQAVLKHMKDQKSGSIINISSIGGLVPDLARIGYVTSKAMINALTQNIASHVAKDNIRCNAVLPGLIQTDAVAKNLDEKFKNIFLTNTPLKRLGETEDIANLVLFLASDLSSYITGEIISVAGGFGKFTPLYGWFNS